MSVNLIMIINIYLLSMQKVCLKEGFGALQGVPKGVISKFGI
jgi:hypothetical protein